MPAHPFCTDLTCPQKCCSRLGYCINTNSTQLAQSTCFFFYSSFEWQDKDKAKAEDNSWLNEARKNFQQRKSSSFPVTYAVPLIVIGSVLIVVLAIVIHRCFKRRKEEKQQSGSQSSGDDKLTSIYHQAFAQSSASDLMPYGINQHNLGPPPTVRNPYFFPYPHPHNNPYNIYNPHLQGNMHQIHVPIHPIPVSSNIGNWRVYQQNLNHGPAAPQNPYFNNHTSPDVRQIGFNGETDGNDAETDKGDTDNGTNGNGGNRGNGSRIGRGQEKAKTEG